MTKTSIRLLAASALALSAGFIGFSQASAFTLDQGSVILAQAGGGSGGAGGGSGGAGSSGGAGGGAGGDPAAVPGNPEPQKNSGMGTNQPTGGARGADPSVGSPSAGVPAQCAAMTNASERAACIERNRATSPSAPASPRR